MKQDGTYQEKTLNINQNGNYTLNPDTGYDAMSSVHIGVSVSGSGETILDVGDNNVSVSGTTLVFEESEYTELEYIEGTGTQYILTSLFVSSGYKVVADVYMASSVTGENCFFGWKDNGESPEEAMECYFKSGKLGYWIKTSSSSNSTLETATTYYNQKVHYEAEETASGCKITINNITTYSARNKLSRRSNIAAMIFGYNAEGSANYLFRGRLYSLKIYENDVLVGDFIPVNLKGIICLYDKVSDKYYENIGTGTFIAGPEVGGNE